jgi:nucleoside diphosphate kinase
MKKQINEIKRMQQLAGLIKEGQLNEETIFADYSSDTTDSDIKTKLARNLSEEIYALEAEEGTIDSLFTQEMEQYAEGNDDFYANREEALQAFTELPDTFTITNNIDGDEGMHKAIITKTGPESWKANVIS